MFKNIIVVSVLSAAFISCKNSDNKTSAQTQKQEDDKKIALNFVTTTTTGLTEAAIEGKYSCELSKKEETNFTFDKNTTNPIKIFSDETCSFEITKISYQNNTDAINLVSVQTNKFSNKDSSPTLAYLQDGNKVAQVKIEFKAPSKIEITIFDLKQNSSVDSLKVEQIKANETVLNAKKHNVTTKYETKIENNTFKSTLVIVPDADASVAKYYIGDTANILLDTEIKKHSNKPNFNLGSIFALPDVKAAIEAKFSPIAEKINVSNLNQNKYVHFFTEGNAYVGYIQIKSISSIKEDASNLLK